MLTLLITLSVTATLAALSWNYIGKRFMKWTNIFFYNKTPKFSFYKLRYFYFKRCQRN
jgi:peptidoglycan/LPS O-acetylase OafA/YrhL